MCVAQLQRTARARPTARRNSRCSCLMPGSSVSFPWELGGNAGRLVPAVNATDHASALGKGYVVIVTDTGHTGNGTDANWVIGPDGRRDQAKIVDFFYRAEHGVTVAGKHLAEAYYAAPVQHAYFDGCSNGGRMAMMEADRYPSDYDGIIAGDPGMDYNSAMLRFAVQKVALSSPDAYLPQQTLVAIDKVVTERCDAIDGATDGFGTGSRAVPHPAREPGLPWRQHRRLSVPGAGPRTARLHDVAARSARTRAVSRLGHHQSVRRARHWLLDHRRHRRPISRSASCRGGATPMRRHADGCSRARR